MGVIAAVVVGIAVLIGVAVLLGLVDSPMSTEPVDRLDPGLPTDRQLTSQDVGGLRFRVGLRGYRMDDVDAALDRLRDALHESEQRAAGEAEASPPAEPAVADDAE
ncbi:MAG: DivIVA domain-containing protein [Mycobacteriales bacterium]